MPPQQFHRLLDVVGDSLDFRTHPRPHSSLSDQYYPVDLENCATWRNLSYTKAR
jgi:hypothetical protein